MINTGHKEFDEGQRAYLDGEYFCNIPYDRLEQLSLRIDWVSGWFYSYKNSNTYEW